jgi:hypothetical protein
VCPALLWPAPVMSRVVRLRAAAGLTAAGVLVRLQVVWGLARSAWLWLASGEEVEDTEMVHAVTPDGGIGEVLISDGALARPAAADVAAALRVGLAQGAVVFLSRSWGVQCFTAAEVARRNPALRAAGDQGVRVVNSAAA